MSERADRLTKLSTAAALLLLIACGFLFRTLFAGRVMPPPPRMQGETTQAYRYARMISQGKEIPVTDPLVLHPEGFATGRNSIFEEYIAGWLHRLAGGSFDVFIRFFSRLFPLLAAVGIYLWVRAAGFRRGSALLAAAAYAVLLPALLRSRGESLYRETVALPILAFLGASLERSLKGGGRSVQAASGVLLLAGLASWKVTGFLAVFLFAWLTVRQTRRGDVPRLMVLSLAGAQLLGSLLLSHMRSDGAILSPASALALAAAASVVLARSWWIPVAGAALAVVLGILGPESTAHVTDVIVAKLTHPGGHPTDPVELTPDARLFWVSGYTSPSITQLLWLFALPAALAVPGVLRHRRRFAGGAILPFAIASLAGYLFFDRLAVFGAMAVSLLLVGTLSTGWVLPVASMLLLGAHSLTAPASARLLARAGGEVGGSGSMLTEEELAGVLSWARKTTEEDEAFLCYWHLSGMISAYADRPVVTHTFFESQRNRRRIHRFAEAVFAPEDSLLAMMRSHRADYVVYQADFLFDRSPQGLLYLAGLQEVPDGSAAVMMHYAPGLLDSLVPVYRGRSLRIYARGSAAAEVAPRRDSVPQVLFEPVYYRLFQGSYARGVSAATDPAGAARRMANSGRSAGDPVRLSAALALLADAGAPASDGVAVLAELAGLHMAGVWPVDRLESDFACYLHAWGPDPEARLDLASLLLDSGNSESAVRQLELAESRLGETTRTRALRRRLRREGAAQ